MLTLRMKDTFIPSSQDQHRGSPLEMVAKNVRQKTNHQKFMHFHINNLNTIVVNLKTSSLD